MPGNVVQELGIGIADSFKNVGGEVINFVPKLLIALIIFIAGWLIGAILGRFIAQLVRAAKIDNVLKGAGVEDVLSKAGFHLDAGGFLGGLVKWFIIVVALVTSFDILGLSTVNVFLTTVVLQYLPKVIASVLILLIAAVIADSMQKVVTGSAKAAGVVYAEFLGGITRWSIWLFAILIALDQLGIVQQFAQTLFTGIVFMLALAGGLAFGLGGKDVAARFLDKLRSDIGSRHH